MPPKAIDIRMRIPAGSLLEEFLRDHQQPARILLDLAVIGMVASRQGVTVNVFNGPTKDAVPNPPEPATAAPLAVTASAVPQLAGAEQASSALADVSDADVDFFRNIGRRADSSSQPA